MKFMDYAIIIITMFTYFYFTNAHIEKNHKIVLSQIQKSIEADTKFINALEAVLKGE